jgi:hypothetical protein
MKVQVALVSLFFGLLTASPIPQRSDKCPKGKMWNDPTGGVFCLGVHSPQSGQNFFEDKEFQPTCLEGQHAYKKDLAKGWSCLNYTAEADREQQRWRKAESSPLAIDASDVGWGKKRGIH